MFRLYPTTKTRFIVIKRIFKHKCYSKRLKNNQCSFMVSLSGEFTKIWPDNLKQCQTIAKKIVSLQELISDHNLIKIHMQIRLNPEPHKINSRNWTHFQNHFNAVPAELLPINSTLDTDLPVETITIDIIRVVESASTRDLLMSFIN